MGEIQAPRRMFLWSMALIYLCSFTSLYIQIPGLYGDEGVVPAKLQIPKVKKPLLEQIQASPSLLWLGPSLGIGAQQSLELICLLGGLLSLGAVLLCGLRNSLVYFCLWALYLSLYTVGGDFLQTEWDNLLLEAGFLAFLVALSGSSFSPDAVVFWLVRWLLFRLVFSTGVSKLASGDPSWWDLTAVNRHYETQASPTPLAWYACELPDWLSRLGAVCVIVSEIAAPLLIYFIPIRELRMSAFNVQVFSQLCAILLGGCSISHLLTIALSFSLLDDDFCFFATNKKKTKTRTWGQCLQSLLTSVIKLCVCLLIIFAAIKFFKLEINWEKKIILSKTDFTRKAFDDSVKMMQEPTVWIGVLSLTWELVAALLKCLYTRGILGKLWAFIQWAVFSAAAVGVFSLSLVPYSALTGMPESKILPVVRKAYDVVEKFHLVSSYGIQHRMVPPAGRPEIIIEGSMDKKTWTELNFMHKPDSVREIPAVVGPYEPRLDQLLWEAARGEHDQSLWFTGLMRRLLEGKQDVVGLLQVDEAQYPFSSAPPAFLRAKVYHYHFTRTAEDGAQPESWWKRQYVRDFFPTVHLNDPAFQELLSEAWPKKEFQVQPVSNTLVSRVLDELQDHARGVSGPTLMSTLLASVAVILLLKAMFSGSESPKGTKPKPHVEHRSKKPRESHEASEKNRVAANRGDKKEVSEERKRPDSDRSPRKRK